MLKVSEIAFSCYAVTDMPRARAFYEGVLGLQGTGLFQEDPPQPGSPIGTSLTGGQGEAGLGPLPVAFQEAGLGLGEVEGPHRAGRERRLLPAP